MTGPGLSTADMEAVRSAWKSRFLNTTADDTTIDYEDGDGKNAHFLRCWRRQSCKSCLGLSACSWCPFSAVCAPNDHLIPALAPAFDGSLVCPYWAERWEMRTRPLGCQVSTITSLTALVAGSGTLVVATLCFVVVVGIQRMRQGWLSRPVPITSDASESDHEPDNVPDENTPLLPG